MKDPKDACTVQSLDGVSIAYWKSEGISGKQTIVLHPGSGVNHSALERLEEELNKKGHPTILFDPRPTGNSITPPNEAYFTLDRFSHDLDAILSKENVKKPIFVTHSFGFMPVVDYAARTGNAERIIAISGSYNFLETTISKPFALLFHHVLRYPFDVLPSRVRLFLSPSSPSAPPDLKLAEGKTQGYIFALSRKRHFYEHKRLLPSFKQILKADVSDQIKELQMPLHLIYGAQDHLVRPAAGEHIKQLAKAPCTTEIIEGTHAFPVLKPRETAFAVSKYL